MDKILMVVALVVIVIAYIYDETGRMSEEEKEFILYGCMFLFFVVFCALGGAIALVC